MLYCAHSNLQKHRAKQNAKQKMYSLQAILSCVPPYQNQVGAHGKKMLTFLQETNSLLALRRPFHHVRSADIQILASLANPEKNIAQCDVVQNLGRWRCDRDR